ncbi:YkgJ family cysteine cluster protein [Natronospora cellulosivora (SeqCode)]
MEEDLQRIMDISKSKEKENEEFRIFLKGCNHHQVDKIVHELNIKYSKEIDCTKCANCCKKLIPALSLDETKDIAKFLTLDYDEFSKKYIERETAGGFTFQGNSCPFLSDKKCSVYDCRPEACSSFPHLHKDNINHRLLNIINNNHLCPIIFNVLEDLKSIFLDKEDAV